MVMFDEGQDDPDRPISPTPVNASRRLRPTTVYFAASIISKAREGEGEEPCLGFSGAAGPSVQSWSAPASRSRSICSGYEESPRRPGYLARLRP
ncbi:hypothetical protein BHM03_00025631 [Ensete ventricosum]|nr:hypothetical protein BHM03_00025631 [Ensete ventricosum]